MALRQPTLASVDWSVAVDLAAAHWLAQFPRRADQCNALGGGRGSCTGELRHLPESYLSRRTPVFLFFNSSTTSPLSPSLLRFPSVAMASTKKSKTPKEFASA